ncbi:MAG: type II/IV secretion system protein [Defluviitaleaceae bacterium]|nr:type II/IV secretion system protein [Defluviitaleaceae bacterium]
MKINFEEQLKKFSIETWGKVYPERSALDLIDYNFSKETVSLPMKLEGNTLYLAMANPFNKQVLESVYLYFRDYEIMIYYLDGDTLSEYTEHFFNEKIEKLTPVVNTIESIIEQAILKRASDIHIEPSISTLNVRFRIDGKLQEQQSLRLDLAQMIATRLKIMASIDIAGTRTPRDGSIKNEYNIHKNIDFRISTMPTIYGEKIVIRLIYKEAENFTLEKIFKEKDLPLVKKFLNSPGIILLTGPTGSGKTTTLYSFLHYLNDSSKNIITIEDPVENTIKGITHINVSENLNFSKALRHILRQDPDIIMIGEIRDKETAGIAIRAANTGHLVLSTLHTNDAESAITRLYDLGIEKFMLKDTLKGVIAQRLFRKICSCKSLNGCEACFNTGFKGRLAIYEILTYQNGTHLPYRTIKENIQEAIKNGEIETAEES